jgi:hypothetical protein
VLPIYFLAFLLVCLGSIAFRRRPRSARAFYRVALVLAGLPYLMYVRYTWGWVSGFGDPSPRIGVYPGLVAFAVVGALTTIALVAAAWVLVRRIPLAAAALPPALWLLFRFGSFPLVYWRGPPFIPIDNKPLIWLLAFSAFATVLLALSAFVALARPGLVPASARQSSDLSSRG